MNLQHALFLQETGRAPLNRVSAGGDAYDRQPVADTQ